MEIWELKTTVVVETGLHIGGSDDAMHIGGIDNPVIKTTQKPGGEKLPYIPGSSLKGKMRSLLETKYDLNKYVKKKVKNNKNNGDSKMELSGEPFGSKFLKDIGDKNSINYQKAVVLLKLFGDSKDKSNEFKGGITRISVSDCPINLVNGVEEYTEAKMENAIDRNNGTASNPRQTERVSAGNTFDAKIRVKVLPNDVLNDFKNMVEDGLNLVEKDYLGGNGSRGYGRVKFTERKWERLEPKNDAL